MKKLMALTAFTVFTTAQAHWLDHLLQKVDNQSSCTLLLVDHYHSSDVTNHDAPLTIQPYSAGFIEMEGTASSQYINSYAVICDLQPVGLGQIFNSNKVRPDTALFFQGDGISWDYYRSPLTRGYPAYVVVSNK